MFRFMYYDYFNRFQNSLSRFGQSQTVTDRFIMISLQCITVTVIRTPIFGSIQFTKVALITFINGHIMYDKNHVMHSFKQLIMFTPN